MAASSAMSDGTSPSLFTAATLAPWLIRYLQQGHPHQHVTPRVLGFRTMTQAIKQHHKVFAFLTQVQLPNEDLISQFLD